MKEKLIRTPEGWEVILIIDDVAVLRVHDLWGLPERQVSELFRKPVKRRAEHVIEL